MNKILSSYIDTNIIDENANKKSRDGYVLDIQELNEHDIDNFLTFLFKNDEALKELILDHMQELIDERLPIVECQDKYDAGYWPIQDRNNGEIFWKLRGI